MSSHHRIIQAAAAAAAIGALCAPPALAGPGDVAVDYAEAYVAHVHHARLVTSSECDYTAATSTATCRVRFNTRKRGCTARLHVYLADGAVFERKPLVCRRRKWKVWTVSYGDFVNDGVPVTGGR